MYCVQNDNRKGTLLEKDLINVTTIKGSQLEQNGCTCSSVSHFRC